MSEPMQETDTNRRGTKRKSSMECFILEKMFRFDGNNMMSRIQPLDHAWPMEPWKPRDHICSARYFMKGNYDYTKDQISPTHFLDLTQIQIYSFGGGNKIGRDIAELVWQQAMRHMTLYLNNMYAHALENQRSFINSEDVFSVLRPERDIAFRNFCQHFLPDPRIDPAGFNFPLCNILIEKYNTDREFREMIESPELYGRIMQAAAKMNLNRFNVEISGVFDPEVERVSFLASKSKVSALFADMFHVALAMPPLEQDIILVIGFMAKQVISEMVRRAIEVAGEGVPLTLEHFQAECNNTEDVLFGYYLGPCVPLREPTPTRPSRHSDTVPQFYHDRQMQRECQQYFKDETTRMPRQEPEPEGFYQWVKSRAN